MEKLTFTQENQQRFLNEKMTEFSQLLFDKLRKEAREKSLHVPEETLRNLSYKIIEDRPGLASEFALSFQDSGRMVDMRRINYRGRAVSKEENFILDWVKKRGLSAFRRRKVPGYDNSAPGVSEEKKLERIANAIIVAKGSQDRRKGKRRNWRYNKIVYTQIDLLREKMRKDQAQWLKDQISNDLKNNGNLTLNG